MNPTREFAAGAARLRKWDAAAQVVGLETPPLDHFTSFIHRAARADAS